MDERAYPGGPPGGGRMTNMAAQQPQWSAPDTSGPGYGELAFPALGMRRFEWGGEGDRGRDLSTCAEEAAGARWLGVTQSCRPKAGLLWLPVVIRIQGALYTPQPSSKAPHRRSSDELLLPDPLMPCPFNP